MTKGALSEGNLRGFVDSFKGTLVSGWAADLAHVQQAPTLLVVIDGKPFATFQCNETRPDVNAQGIAAITPGFRFEVPEALQDGEPHTMSIRFRNGVALPFMSASGENIDETTFLVSPTETFGMVDGMYGTSIRGWLFRTNTRTGEKTGGVTVQVRANGVKLGHVKADLIRNDVADAHGCESHCGFLYSLPPRMRDNKPFVLEFFSVPEETPLVGSPFSGTVLSRDSVDQLNTMYASVEALCTQVYALKDQLRQMVTTDDHTLGTYNNWAAQYLPALRARLRAERDGARYRELVARKRPKISVLCPTYKPNLPDFIAAIDSVRHQSWQDWELIVVDDGSNDAKLTATIDAQVQLDARIRAVPLAKNQGISAATSAAIAAATGDYIALFDHDDLLVDVALEIMAVAALDTGAKLLYSDEDKIDRHGIHSEPHLKTDWNYRLLLTNNYVCHLLMVEADTLRQAAPLRAKYDGAQDHDLILRLSEIVPAHDIHHVQEILYHWRKSATSTASAQSTKSYAMEAGRAAVADHLARRGLPATVEPLRSSTLYAVHWHMLETPRVAILVPFKDQVETTQRCVEMILKATTYPNYEIVLIDNWSTDPLTAKWVRTLAKNPKIRVVRIEENFNFSRINNIAVASTTADYYLFLNNDIFVSQPDWMRLLVDEALADRQVGAVGAKLIYPNQTVQHGGVVLGVGGVADHTFRYHALDDVGYFFHAICAQDMSVVTAACMLTRAEAFHAAGGFDETKLAVAFNDVDLCLKIGRAGYRIVFTPAVVAEHHESLSRGSDLLDHTIARFYEENQVMMDRWGDLIRNDPFYSPHFSHETGMFEKLSNRSLNAKAGPRLFAGARHAASMIPAGPANPVFAVADAETVATPVKDGAAVSKPEPVKPAKLAKRLRMAAPASV